MAVLRRAHTTQLERRSLRGLALAGVVALSLLAAACGGGSGAKVAQIGTTTSSKIGPTRSTANAMAYSKCMRSHGVPNFPDPDLDENGRIRIVGGTDANQGRVKMNTPQAKKATRACQKLQPNGGRLTAAQEAQDEEMFLKYAQCMRAHGVSKFPDPKPDGGLRIGAKVGIDPNAPIFRAAQQACRKLVPDIPAAPSQGPSSGSGTGSASPGTMTAP